MRPYPVFRALTAASTPLSAAVRDLPIPAREHLPVLLNAPGYDGTISGQGDFTGAIAASTLTISVSFHYDEALSGGGSPGIGNYAFASWFEDNSDPTHKDVNGNYVVY